MSDLCMYELEDIAWDDLCLSDEHTVPRPRSENSDGKSGLVDGQKKPPYEVSSLHNQDKYAAGHVCPGRENGEFASLSGKRSKMLEKNPWAHTAGDIFSSSPDRDVARIASDAASKEVSSGHILKSNNKDSIRNELCTLLDKTTAVGKNCFSYPLPDATFKEDNLDLFEKVEAGDSGDLLYYDWPEIGNFDDVDSMFRSCESTFGLDGNKDDGLGWFASANDGESKDEMKVTYSENDGCKSITINDSSMNNVPHAHMDDFWISDKSQSCISFSDGNGGFISKGQTVDERTESGLQKQSGGKRKEHELGNGSCSYLSTLSNEGTQGATSHLDFSSGAMQQQHALNPCSYGDTQNPFTYIHPEVNNDLASLSPRDDLSVLSPRVHYMESFGEPLLQATVPEGLGKREKLQKHRNSQSSINDTPMDTSNGASLSDSTKHVQPKVENYGDAEGVFQVIPAELGSSIAQESPTGSSGTEDNSLEAAGFRQLQLVTEQLDLKTKLCIRDSLYRLARSAEQRHNHTNSNSPNRNEREGSGAVMAEDANDFMDMETQTNPIDRSVAHLLFHRAPSESSVTPSCDLLPSKLPSAVQPISCLSAKEEDLVICDETVSENREGG